MKLEYRPLLGSKVFEESYGKLTNDEKNLKLKVAKFKEEYEILRVDNPTFTEFVLELMEKKKWDRKIFKDRTLLSDSTFTQIINNFKKGWEHQTVVAIAVGLELHLYTAEKLLSLAGLCFGESKEHQAYKFLFTEFRGWAIYECNAFLESVGVPILGCLHRNS